MWCVVNKKTSITDKKGHREFQFQVGGRGGGLFNKRLFFSEGANLTKNQLQENKLHIINTYGFTGEARQIVYFQNWSCKFL